MFRTHVYLTDAQHERLKRLARAGGRSQSALLREAVDRLLVEATGGDWKGSLRQARGIWKGRDDLDEAMAEARRSMDRSLANA
jgi:Arc/MetJ-type ribon-helix-helix transcriptional regulator